MILNGGFGQSRVCLLSFVTGRMFDFHVLDMFELGIEKFVSLKDVKVNKHFYLMRCVFVCLMETKERLCSSIEGQVSRGHQTNVGVCWRTV